MYLVRHLPTKSRADSENSSESFGIANEPLPIAKMAAMGGISDLLRRSNKFTVIKNSEECCLNRAKIILKVTGQVIHLPWRFSSRHFKDCATYTPVEKTNRKRR